MCRIRIHSTWHSGGFSVLHWQELLKIQDINLPLQEKNTAEKSKKLLKYFSQEKLLMRQKDVVPQPI